MLADVGVGWHVDVAEKNRQRQELALAVPHSEIKKRIDAHRAEAAKNSRKRGPKPKSTNDRG
jgi:hypothetical protein